MKKTMWSLVSLVVFILCPTFLWAATIYVSPTGAGSKTGSDWNNAYQGLPSSMVRGNTYVITGGSYSAKSFSDAQSGSTVITIRKASSLPQYRDDLIAGWNSNYERDQAVFTGQSTFNTGYYIIDGITPSTGHWQTSGYGIKFRATSSGTKYLVTTGSSSVNYVTLKHIEYQHLGSSSDTQQFAIHPGLDGTFDSWTVANSYFHELQVFMKLSGYAPKGWIIEHNYFGINWSSSTNHGEQLSFSHLGGSTPHHVRYNWFEPFRGTGSLIYLWYQNKTANDISIYGNVWHNPPSGGNGVIGTGSTGNSPLNYDNWKIYNNTFINGTAQIAIGFADSPPTGWEIRNNVFYNCQARYMFGAPNGVISNNYRNGGSWGLGTCTNCVTSAEPVSTLFPNYSSGDYRIGSNSQAIDAGFSLSSPYNLDPVGTSRPQSTAFDMGAYEFSTGSALAMPNPPTNLRIN